LICLDFHFISGEPRIKLLQQIYVELSENACQGSNKSFDEVK